METLIQDEPNSTKEHLRRVDDDDSLLHSGAHTLASAMGVASAVGAFAGPEGVVAGAVFGAVVGVLLSRYRRYRSV